MKNVAKAVGASVEQIGPSSIEEILDSYLHELGRRIFSLRKTNGLSQQALADAANLDRTYISAVEHGKQNVTVGAIVKLSIALKIPLKHLLIGITQ